MGPTKEMVITQEMRDRVNKLKELPLFKLVCDTFKTNSILKFPMFGISHERIEGDPCYLIVSAEEFFATNGPAQKLIDSGECKVNDSPDARLLVIHWHWSYVGDLIKTKNLRPFGKNEHWFWSDYTEDFEDMPNGANKLPTIRRIQREHIIDESLEILSNKLDPIINEVKEYYKKNPSLIKNVKSTLYFRNRCAVCHKVPLPNPTRCYGKDKHPLIHYEYIVSETHQLEEKNLMTCEKIRCPIEKCSPNNFRPLRVDDSTIPTFDDIKTLFSLIIFCCSCETYYFNAKEYFCDHLKLLISSDSEKELIIAEPQPNSSTSTPSTVSSDTQPIVKKKKKYKSKGKKITIDKSSQKITLNYPKTTFKPLTIPSDPKDMSPTLTQNIESPTRTSDDKLNIKTSTVISETLDKETILRQIELRSKNTQLSWQNPEFINKCKDFLNKVKSTVTDTNEDTIFFDSDSVSEHLLNVQTINTQNESLLDQITSLTKQINDLKLANFSLDTKSSTLTTANSNLIRDNEELLKLLSKLSIEFSEHIVHDEIQRDITQKSFNEYIRIRDKEEDALIKLKKTTNSLLDIIPPKQMSSYQVLQYCRDRHISIPDGIENAIKALENKFKELEIKLESKSSIAPFLSTPSTNTSLSSIAETPVTTSQPMTSTPPLPIITSPPTTQTITDTPVAVKPTIKPKTYSLSKLAKSVINPTTTSNPIIMSSTQSSLPRDSMPSNEEITETTTQENKKKRKRITDSPDSDLD